MEKILYFLKQNWKDILMIGLLITCIILITIKFYLTSAEDQTTSDTPTLAAITQEEATPSTLYNIDIKGAIKEPGVYQVPSGSIVNDVIKLAGGLTENAYQNGINLSKKVNDEMVIYIYTQEEIAKSKEESTEENTEVCNTPSYNICDCVDKNSSLIAPETSTTPTDTSKDSQEASNKPTIVNINTASIEELTTLNGIGKSKAEAIIKYREENGKFTSPTDLLNISGIGETVFAKIKDFITV